MKKTTKSKNEKSYKLPKGKALALRTCNPDMTSHGGFEWPKTGRVKCADWSKEAVCGKGLHGLLWGEGDGSLLGESNCPHLVVEIDESAKVDLLGKVKFPSCTVVHCGDAKSATDFIREHGGRGRSIVMGTSTSGEMGTSTSGYMGTSTSGDGGTSTSGVMGTSKTGSVGIVVCRWWDAKAERSRLTVGYVGEDGIKPDTFYRCDDAGKLTEDKP